MGQLVDLSQGCRVLAYPAEKPYAFIRPVDGTRVFVAFHAVEPAVDEVLVQGWPAAGGIQYTAVPGSWPDCEVPDEALAGAMLNPKVVREQGPSGAICPVPGSVVSPDDGTGHLTLIPIEPQGLCDSLCSAGGDLQAGDQVLVCTAVEGRKCLGLKRVCDQRAGPALVTRCVASGGDGKPYDGIQVDGSLMTGPGARRIEYLPLADAVFPLADAPWMLHGDGDRKSVV